MTIHEALNILKPTSQDDLKRAFRDAAKRYHPDLCGGNPEFMKLVNLAHEMLSANKFWKEQTIFTEPSLTDKLAKIYKIIKFFKDIKIEVAGSWFWITGNTKPYKAAFNALGFKFSGKKKAWYYHEDKYRKLTKFKWSMDMIRARFNSEELKTDKMKAVAG